MQKITPHLWYDREAREAADFYVSVFSGRGDAKIKSSTTIPNTPSGSVDTSPSSCWGSSSRP